MRSDGDTWDIVSSVGRTALGVATYRAIESERPDALIHDEFARWFVEAAGDEFFIDALEHPESVGERNVIAHTLGPRTKFFDDYFLDAANAGVRQAVILASGLDARAYRLNWPAGTGVFEIDQAKVLEFKDRVIVEHGGRPTADRVAVAVDLRDDWPAALAAAGFDSSAPTAWSAEGLLPYLPGAAQDALFVHIDRLSVPGSRLAAHGGASGGMKKFLETARKYFDHSPFGENQPADLWYDDERADPLEWLTERGWTVRSFPMDELITSYGRPLPLLPADLPPELIAMRNRAAFWSAIRA
jgi:methyltransferase (TIGR00027 family)